MVAFEYEGVELDHCMQCKGTWLDRGELEQIARLAGVAEQGALSGRIANTPRRSKSPRRCPRCKRPLELTTVPLEGRELSIDRCPRGDGLWFDQGELAALIHGAAPDPADEAAARFLAGLFHHELQQSKKGA
jgi:Zn-finger nucleic acid-binding protein